MPTLPGPWHAAASLNRPLDLSHGRAEALNASAVQVESLLRCGLSMDDALLLASGQARSVDHPFITRTDPRYPPLLAALAHAPPVLFYAGSAALLKEPAVAIVGSRHCTSAGRRIASQLAREAALAGFAIVSGLAQGIDEAAHDAATDHTIAVLGHGLDTATHGKRQSLAERIVADGGLLLSEFLPEVPPARWTFPRRNRVIAGLARATVVVEAAHRSGALITARYALQAGREVLAVPGSPLSEASAGTNQLIWDGAGMVRDGRDLLEALGHVAPRPTTPDGSSPLLQAIGRGATFEELVHRTDQAPAQLCRSLAALELTGTIERLSGDRYRLV